MGTQFNKLESSSTIIGSIIFFWAFGTIQLITYPFSSFSWAKASSSENVIFSGSLSLKKSLRFVPKHSKISTRVAIEGEVNSLSNCEINHLDNSHLLASSSCVRLFFILNRLIFSPICIMNSCHKNIFRKFDLPKQIV